MPAHCAQGTEGSCRAPMAWHWGNKLLHSAWSSPYKCLVHFWQQRHQLEAAVPGHETCLCFCPFPWYEAQRWCLTEVAGQTTCLHLCCFP